MACLTVLFIVILTTVSEVTSLHCSDQQLPPSGDDDLQQVTTLQVTTLQYCLVDDCTIMKIDIGEKLDIVYTTNSLIVTIPMDGHSSEVIARLKNELPCLEPTSTSNDYRLQVAGELATFLLLHVLSWYIIAVHIMFKELRNLFGKLLMLYSIAVIFSSIGFISRYLPLLQLVPNSLVFRYPSILCLFISTVSIEALGTCILHHIVMTIRHCYKLRSQISKETSQRHFRNYIVYTLGTILLVVFLSICFDMAKGNYKDTLLPNGLCVSVEIRISGTLIIPGLFNGINKMVQLVQFIIYLHHMHKVNKYVTDAGISKGQLSILHKIATAMGAMVGLTYFVSLIQTIMNFDVNTIAPVLVGFFFTVHCCTYPPVYKEGASHV